MRKNPADTALLGPTRLLISDKSVIYMIKWSYTIIWQVRVGDITEQKEIGACSIIFPTSRDQIWDIVSSFGKIYKDD